MTDFPHKPTERLPEPVTELAALLETHGHATFWVGEGLVETALGRAPSGFSLVTAASSQAIANLLATAIPCRPEGGSFVVPSSAGPIDLAPLGSGIEIDSHLKLRGFSLLALAWRLTRREWVDPWSGLEDLENRRLRCVLEPQQVLKQVPRRVLQIARLVATLQLEVDIAVETAMGKVFAEQFHTLPPCDLRYELNELLLAKYPAPGLDILHRTGADSTLGLAIDQDTAGLIASAPRDLGLRWAIWLRGTRGTRNLRKFRIDPNLAKRIQRLHSHHPIEERLPPGRNKIVRKGIARLGRGDCQKLIDLRYLELDAETGEEATRQRSELARLADAIEFEANKVERVDHQVRPLLGGREVMEILKIGPSPQVGKALAFLTRRVTADPSCNTQSSLRALVLEWAAQQTEA